MKKKEIVQLPPGDRVVEQNRDIIVVERDVPPISYEIVEGNFKHLQGQILTMLEATIGDARQLEATKQLVKGFFNNKLTHLFSIYGYTTTKETPDYSKPDYLKEDDK